jgi:hypothetical protein
MDDAVCRKRCLYQAQEAVLQHYRQLSREHGWNLALLLLVTELSGRECSMVLNGQYCGDNVDCTRHGRPDFFAVRRREREIILHLPGGTKRLVRRCFRYRLRSGFRVARLGLRSPARKPDRPR